jgi:hypothetical protein
MSTTTIHYEVTDTFGGEANYSWVNKGSIEIPTDLSDLALVRRIKAEIGWSNVRCQKEDYGDMIKLKPYGVCQVCFINSCP